MLGKTLSLAAFALATALSAPSAQASDWRGQWSIQVGVPLPVLAIPVPRIEVVPVYVRPDWGDRDRDGVPNWRDRYDDRWSDRPGHRPGWRVDRDRDGIPDWRDPYDNRRHWRRDSHDHRPAWRDRW